MVRMVDVHSFQQVWVDRMQRARLAGVLPWVYGLDAHFPHVAQDGLGVEMDSIVALQPSPDAPIAKLWVRRVDFVDVVLHLQIFGTGRNGMVVQRASIDPEKLCLFRDRNVLVVEIDQLAAFCRRQLRGQIFFSATRFEW